MSVILDTTTNSAPAALDTGADTTKSGLLSPLNIQIIPATISPNNALSPTVVYPNTTSPNNTNRSQTVVYADVTSPNNALSPTIAYPNTTSPNNALSPTVVYPNTTSPNNNTHSVSVSYNVVSPKDRPESIQTNLPQTNDGYDNSSRDVDPKDQKNDTYAFHAADLASVMNKKALPSKNMAQETIEKRVRAVRAMQVEAYKLGVNSKNPDAVIQSILGKKEGGERTEAYYNLGIYFRYVHADFSLAVKYFSLAAKEKHPEALYCMFECSKSVNVFMRGENHNLVFSALQQNSMQMDSTEFLTLAASMDHPAALNALANDVKLSSEVRSVFAQRAAALNANGSTYWTAWDALPTWNFTSNENEAGKRVQELTPGLAGALKQIADLKKALILTPEEQQQLKQVAAQKDNVLLSASNAAREEMLQQQAAKFREDPVLAIYYVYCLSALKATTESSRGIANGDIANNDSNNLDLASTAVSFVGSAIPFLSPITDLVQSGLNLLSANQKQDYRRIIAARFPGDSDPHFILQLAVEMTLAREEAIKKMKQPTSVFEKLVNYGNRALAFLTVDDMKRSPLTRQIQKDVGAVFDAIVEDGEENAIKQTFTIKDMVRAGTGQPVEEWKIEETSSSKDVAVVSPRNNNTTISSSSRSTNSMGSGFDLDMFDRMTSVAGYHGLLAEKAEHIVKQDENNSSPALKKMATMVIEKNKQIQVKVEFDRKVSRANMEFSRQASSLATNGDRSGVSSLNRTSSALTIPHVQVQPPSPGSGNNNNYLNVPGGRQQLDRMTSAVIIPKGQVQPNSPKSPGSGNNNNNLTLPMGGNQQWGRMTSSAASDFPMMPAQNGSPSGDITPIGNGSPRNATSPKFANDFYLKDVRLLQAQVADLTDKNDKQAKEMKEQAEALKELMAWKKAITEQQQKAPAPKASFWSWFVCSSKTSTQ